MDDDILIAIAFVGTIIEWRGPSPFFFIVVPAVYEGEIRWAARSASYGWGVVPVEAAIGTTAFRTSLFPGDGGYLLPVRAKVRSHADIALGDRVRVSLTIRAAACPTG